MHGYQILLKYQHKINYKDSEEYKLVSSFKNKLKDIPFLKNFLSKYIDFALIELNIFAQALKNKEYIEDRSRYYIHQANNLDGKNISELIKNDIHQNSLSYFIFNNKEYFLPLFNYAINNIYSYEQIKLKNPPFNLLKNSYVDKIIDMFETYNFALYDSTFTHLIKVKKRDNIMVFYHPFFRSLYFINEQGRLDYKLALFDKYLEDINLKHIIIRVDHAIDAYFDNRRDLMFLELYNNHLISDKVFSKIKKKKV